MEHLDEGTIHGWIDGALDATQSREIEAHVASCATCSAAVAEARGLIAASSRILTALDDVPGDVVPKRAPVALPAAATPTFRRWRVSAWVPALAAAALIVAVGLQVSDRAGVASKQDVAPDSELGLRATLAREVAADSAAPQRAVANAQSLTVGGATRATRGLAAAASSASARDMSLGDVRPRAETRVTAAGGAGVSSPTTQQAATPSVPPSVRFDEVVVTSKKESVPAAKSAAEPSAVAVDTTRLQLESANRRFARGNVGPVLVVAGCYALSEEAKRSMTVVAGGVAGVPSERTRALADARARRAAPATAAASGLAQTTGPAIVRLDTIAQPAGMRVVTERGDTVIGWWSRFGSDSARVRLLSGTAFTLEAKNRVTCVEPPRQ